MARKIKTKAVKAVKPAAKTKAVQQQTHQHEHLNPHEMAQTVLYKTLYQGLSIKRPHKGVGEAAFTDWLEDNLPDGVTHFRDDANNLHVDARTDKKHRTLFVAHVDTVHRNEGRNQILVSKNAWLSGKDSVLGADDGAGVALLMHLLYGGVAAYYIFTQGEERGGIGARHLAMKHGALLAQFDRAIAFDRRGLDSVISHQGWGRCCSDKFAETLANELNNIEPEFMYAPDDGGIYTDTAEFVDVIPECTNISVGYFNEHTDREYLNTAHYEHLAAAVLRIDWDNLPVVRDPDVQEELEATRWGWQTMGKSTSKYTAPKDEHEYVDGELYCTPWWENGAEVGAKEEYYLADVRDAIEDARCGYPEFLLELIAECAYPDDPKIALKHLNKNNLAPESLEEALDFLRAGGEPEDALLSLFDEVYTVN